MTTTIRRLPRIFPLAALLLGAMSAGAQAAPVVQQETFKFSNWEMQRVTLPGNDGPPVSYYLSTPKARAPLVLVVQGSGCAPPFSGLGTEKRSSSVFNWVPLASSGRYAMMAVDKPYQPAQQEGTPGQAAGCGDAFNNYYSYDTWLATLSTALRHALARPEVDASRVFVIGVVTAGQKLLRNIQTCAV